MQLGEFFIALGFDVDNQKLKEFKQDINDGIGDLVKLSATAAASVYALNKFVEGSIRSATALRNFRTETGESSTELQRWQNVVTLTDSSATVDQVTASVKGLSKAMADVTMGKGGGVFNMLGIDTRGKDPFQVLRELRENYLKNPAPWGNVQNTTDLLGQIGVDPSFINSFKLSNQEFDKLYNLPIFSEDGQKRVVGLGNAFSMLNYEYKLWKDNSSADWAPQIEQAITKLTPVVKTFLDLFSLGVEGDLRLFNDFVTLAERLGKAIANFPEKEQKWFYNLLDQNISSQPNSPMDNYKKQLKDRYEKTTGQNIKDPSQPMSNYEADQLLKSMKSPEMWNGVKNAAVATGVTFSNQYNIQTNEDADTVARQITTFQQRQLNSTFADQNNGPKY